MNYRYYCNLVEKLMTDNRLGAGVIESKLNAIFISASKKLEANDFARLLEKVSTWRPPMANVLNLLLFLRNNFATDYNRLPFLLKKRDDSIKAERERLCYAASNIIFACKTIATISHSSAVENSIRMAIARGWRGRILIPESRPMCEGRKLASILAKMGTRIEFGVDCLILSKLHEADAAFVGADIVTRTHFVNKIGTSLIIKMMPADKKVYVLADSSKFWKGEIPLLPERPWQEVWRNKPDQVKITNRYFEAIPFSKNTEIVKDGSV